MRWTLFLALMLALAGCTDDSEGGSDAPDEPEEPEDPDDGSGAMPDEEPEAPLATVYHNGTVTGTLDCTLASNDQAPQSPETITLSDEDVNRTYSVSKVAGDDPAPDQSSLCVSTDGGSSYAASMSGTVEPGMTEIRIAADAAPNGVDYSVVIDG